MEAGEQLLLSLLQNNLWVNPKIYKIYQKIYFINNNMNINSTNKEKIKYADQKKGFVNS
jgi:hypothetical protein